MAAQVRDSKDGTFRVEYSPKMTGEHRIHVAYAGESIPGSPFCCKVYDVKAIKVKPTERGMVGKPVTFLGEFLVFCEYILHNSKVFTNA